MNPIDSATSRYINTVQNIPRLSREEEEELISRWKQHRDRRAADRLLNAHLRDVAFIAVKHRFYGVPMSDLIAEGNLGLMRALEKFDADRGTRFSTYAAYWIRAYVVAYVLKSWSLVRNRSGVLRTKTFFKLRRERVRVENQYGEGPEADRILAERLGVTEEQLAELIGRIDGRDVSLDARPGGALSPPLLDTLAGSFDDQEESVGREQVRARVDGALDELLAQLDDRERFIVESRFLADKGEELSLAEVGRQFGVSRERARQLEVRTKNKLRQGLIERCGLEPDALHAA